MDQPLPFRRGPQIDTSEHAARGLVSCSRAGMIAWRGPLAGLAGRTGFDIIHCHDDDVDKVRRILAGGRRGEITSA